MALQNKRSSENKGKSRPNAKEGFGKNAIFTCFVAEVNNLIVGMALVYDRFSTLVYSTENITDLECFLNVNGWDGKHYKTGKDLPFGTYIYEMYFQDFEGWKHQDVGQLSIIR